MPRDWQETLHSHKRDASCFISSRRVGASSSSSGVCACKPLMPAFFPLGVLAQRATSDPHLAPRCRFRRFFVYRCCEHAARSEAQSAKRRQVSTSRQQVSTSRRQVSTSGQQTRCVESMQGYTRASRRATRCLHTGPRQCVCVCVCVCV